MNNVEIVRWDIRTDGTAIPVIWIAVEPAPNNPRRFVAHVFNKMGTVIHTTVPCLYRYIASNIAEEWISVHCDS